MDALRLTSPDRNSLHKLTEDGWQRALLFCERSQLTLALGVECRDGLPDAARLRLDRHLSNNAQRWQRTQAEYRAAASAFEAEGLEHVVLKGFSHCPLFVPDPRHRPLGDLDLYFPARSSAARAGCGNRNWAMSRSKKATGIQSIICPRWSERRAGFGKATRTIRRCRYRSSCTFSFGIIAPNGSPERAGLFLGAPPEQGTGGTAIHQSASGRRDRVFGAAFAAASAARRPPLFHIYELAQVLHRRADDTDVLEYLVRICTIDRCERWRRFALRSQRVGSRAGCPTPRGRQMERLPADVKRWLATYSWSPIAGLFRPNKDELWLHWALLESRRRPRGVLRRRLLPERLPGPVWRHACSREPDHLADARVRNRAIICRYLASRVWHHTRALPPTAWSAARWFSAGLELGSGILAPAGFRRFLRLRNVRLLLPLQPVSAEAGISRELSGTNVRPHDGGQHRWVPCCRYSRSGGSACAGRSWPRSRW